MRQDKFKDKQMQRQLTCENEETNKHPNYLLKIKRRE